VSPPPPFSNEQLLELRRGTVREELLAAGRELDRRLPLDVPVLIAGEACAGSGAELLSHDPCAPARVVARAAAAGAGDAGHAVEVARDGFAAWGSRPAAERATVLRDAAGRLRARRLELAALAMRECAKPWAEADADVCVAIDFLEYYARGALTLDRGAPVEGPPGERNSLRYVPRGVVAVIAPWNFPLAIPAGMVAGGLAAGNAVVLKPAEQSPGCAHALVTALHEAGVPPEALALLPGADEPGAALVGHPGVHVIAFTGSCAVGLEIVRVAAETPPGQNHLKRVVAEMGGKNCVIVDADADLDEAVPAIVRSAFGYAGQKCSAAARVLAHREIAEPLARRLAGAVSTLRVGPADAFGIDVPALIDEEALRRVQGYARTGAREGRLLAEAGPLPEGGFYVAPTLLGELPPDSAVLSDEIFGPVLAVESVRDVDAACDTVDRLRFGLTGGLFSRNPATVRHVASRLPVGNLYVNRDITGAMVGRQPFGGNRLSGTGSKAGGPDYLLQFVEPRVVSENVTRHGLVV
jgi:RHH-type proline utilization regulon transcriptional repressor/proline dehydrogenase/delta 1-pyrroline-5-carboxylate dehydrogenase